MTLSKKLTLSLASMAVLGLLALHKVLKPLNKLKG